MAAKKPLRKHSQFTRRSQDGLWLHQKGQELDYTKTGMLLLDDFRSGKIGRITLELPKGETEEQ